MIREEAEHNMGLVGPIAGKRRALSKCLVSFVCLMVCLLGFTVALVSFAHGEEPEVIRLAGFDYPPYYQKRDGVLEGIAVELAQALFARLNMKPEIHIYPLKRALDLIKSGNADGTMILIKTPERSKHFHFTIPVMSVRGLIWSAADREGGVVNFDTLEDLRQYKIGVTRGYSYGPAFDEMLGTMDVDVANSDYHNYRKLLSHRIEIFPGNEIVAEGLFKEHPELRGKFLHSEKSFIEWVLRIAISKESPYAVLLPAINDELRAMKDEGEVDRIVRKYTQ